MSSASEVAINIGINGRLSAIWDDALADLVDLGTCRIERASHIERAPDHTGWTADLSPVAGPTLGPYRHRRDALAAELEWLNENWRGSRCN